MNEELEAKEWISLFEANVVEYPGEQAKEAVTS